MPLLWPKWWKFFANLYKQADAPTSPELSNDQKTPRSVWETLVVGRTLAQCLASRRVGLFFLGP